MDTNQTDLPQTDDLSSTNRDQLVQPPEVTVSASSSENNSPTVPLAPKTKGKLIPVLLIILILAVLGVGGMYAYKNFFVKAPSPTPTPETTPVPTTNPTANWEVYSNSTHNVSFKYPSSWILTETKGQIENGETYNTIVKLSKNDASVNLYFNMNGIGGMPQTYEGKPFVLDGYNLYQFNKTNSYNKTKEVGLSNSLTTLGVFEINDIAYLINITYPETMNNADEISLLDEFDQILSTFKFTDQKEATTSDKKFGYIRSITPKPDNYLINVDYANFIQDNTAPNGFRIENASVDLFNLQTDIVDRLPVVTMQRYSYGSDGNYNFNQIISFNEFLNAYNSTTLIKNSLYWIETANGVVTKITEQYIP